MNILVTGGAGYIGSHTVVELLAKQHRVVVADNLVNSSPEAIRRLETITKQTIPFFEIDLRDRAKLEALFKDHSFEAVIHFAGLKAVGESVQKPLEYYNNNLYSTLVLLETMQKFEVKKLVFSSSATVYGDPQELPIQETTRTGVGITNPYGQSKYIIEQILTDLAKADPSMAITILRYFNPIGAHQSGLIGEDPGDIPNNLLPYISQVAVGKLQQVSIFGNDYNTSDGTGVRDYIHVVDLAKGHLASLDHIKPGVSIYNLGTGQGTSVLELIRAFEKASQKTIPYQIAERRQGDIATCYASADKAKQELHWQAEKTIDEACQDSWRWQSNNPGGYTNDKK